MKLLLLGSALLSGGVMATEGDVVIDNVKQFTQQVQNRFQNNQSVNIQENGYPYPSEEFLATLTEDQAFEIISYIDVVNATNDWANMSEDEISVAAAEIKAELQSIYIDLGISGPMTQTKTQTQTRARNGGNGKGSNGSGSNDPIGDQDGTCDYVEDTEAPTV